MPARSKTRPRRGTTSNKNVDTLGAKLNWKIIGGVLLIVILTVVVYLPSIDGGFLLDDEGLLTNAPWITAPDGLIQIWCTAEPPDYWPLTYSMFWAEWRLWSNHPLGYHVVNVLLHMSAALLLWLVLHKLKIPGAFLAALLFAIHPVNVESVAWIAQRKNTLAMVFFLLSIFWFLKADDSEDSQNRTFNHWHWLSLLAFVLALLSKGSVAILPAILLGIVWWRRGITKLDLLRLAPFVVVGAGFVGLNIWFQAHANSTAIRHASFIERLLGASGTVWFYLWKALWPFDLAFVYRNWQIDVHAVHWWFTLASAAGVTMLLLWQRNSKYGKPLLFAWGFFCVALLPVMGFTDVGFMRFALVADHYQHIAIIAAVALVAAAWARAFWSDYEILRGVSLAAAAMVVMCFAVLTWQQNELYTDAVTSYRAALAKNPDNWMLHGNLGDALFDAGNTEEAIPELRESLRLNPDSDDAHFYLAQAMVKYHRIPEAIEHYERSIALNPGQMKVNHQLATLYLQLGRRAEALATANKALEIAKKHHADVLVEQIEAWKLKNHLDQLPPSTVPPP